MEPPWNRGDHSAKQADANERQGNAVTQSDDMTDHHHEPDGTAGQLDRRTEALLRELTPGVLATLIRRHGQFDAAEDAVQEALLAAARQWPSDGTPANPHGWLVTVAARRLTDHIRAESARRRRETAVTEMAPADDGVAPAADEQRPAADDALTLLFLCCHPELSPATQAALTLRAVGGLTTAQIAAAFLVPEATMAQRISRAKQKIKAAGARFAPPPASEREARLAVVAHVLYLIFNEGYTTTGGENLHRPELTDEAIRLTRQVRRLLPADGEVAGLLALMLLVDARRPARQRPDGSLVPLAEQDRGQWKSDHITEGLALVTEALGAGPVGEYQLQAAIAAVHAEAKRAEDTDWEQILGLYDVLSKLAPNPMVTLNRAVALAETRGPSAALEALATLESDGRLAEHHRLSAVRAHLLEKAGDRAAAIREYELAASRTTSAPEQRYLTEQANRLRSAPSPEAKKAES